MFTLIFTYSSFSHYLRIDDSELFDSKKNKLCGTEGIYGPHHFLHARWTNILIT